MRLPTFSLALLCPLLAAVSAQAQVNVTINANQVVRTVDPRMFALNTAEWDGSFNDPQTLTALQAVQPLLLRYPGGSSSDDYNWQTNTNVIENTPGGSAPFAMFAPVAKQIGAQAIITVNYGTGNPGLAADWVRESNVTNSYGFKYWEVGNECYGTWEDDTYSLPHDPYTYAVNAVQYITAMKQVDPTIKIGVPVVTGEDSYAVGYTSHPATNSATGVPHNGWTPVVLATMKSLGVLPDFLIYHRYEQNPGNESDSALLQAALTWSQDAANLRGMLTDYVGGSAAAGIELLVTENNSVSYNPGKQTTSLVNGLYMADSLGNLLQTEFNSMVWWDLHNNQISTNNNSSTLYGWREYGDYGIESGNSYAVVNSNPAHDGYPVFYVMKLLTHFARGGDKVVSTTTNNPLLSAYSVVRKDGSLSILVINKSSSTTYTATFAISGYTPQSTATVYTYGMTQDTAAQMGTGSKDIATATLTGAGASFPASFAPYSATVISLTTPVLSPVASAQPSSQTIAPGTTVVFSFPTTGSPAPTYQWSLNGTAIPSATSSNLEITGATSANAGTYTCVATNSSGSLQSGPAVLTVTATNNVGRLVNLSCRAAVGTGGNILISGFAVGGSGTSGQVPLLIRASGPALTGFGVTGTLPDPELQLYQGTTLLASDTGWQASQTISAAAASVGAFSWGSAPTPDSALLQTLAGGAFTAQVLGAGGDTGVALAEVYDTRPAASYAPTQARLVNLSTRVQVGTGGNVLIAGFVIGGTTSRTVLVRASGPALAAFGVPGTLPDPALTLTNLASGAVVATNSGWGGDPTIATNAATVGAFSWGAAATPDSAILITLPPGAYTAEIAGASGDTGVALVEVYEVP